MSGHSIPRGMPAAHKLLMCAIVIALSPTPLYGQTVSTETEVTVGRSTDGTTGAAAQVRLFGTTRADWRFFLESTWGLVNGKEYTDAFSSAYPYDRRLRPMELYVEKMRHLDGGALVGLRAGRYRTPFGISGRSDHAYLGFMRAPLIRYAWNWALSSTYMDMGADLLVGRPSFTVETSLGVPSDEGDAPRRRGFTGVVRAQTYVRSLILGASYINSAVADTDPSVFGRLKLQGIDGRWMHGGIQLRGEWLAGRSDAESTTRGGYLDFISHHRMMGRVTLVARVERLDWDYPKEPEFSAYPRRATIGARIRITPEVHVQAGALRNFARTPGPGDAFSAVIPSTAFDFAVSFGRRF
jgi:hypothetical protein